MKDRIDSMLDMIGLERNTIQVFEGLDEGTPTYTMFFPNFMTKTEVKPWIDDEQLLKLLQEMMEEHAMDVAKALGLLKRYRKTYGK